MSGFAIGFGFGDTLPQQWGGTPAPSPTLNALAGAFSLAENATAGTSAGGLSGMTAGSTLSLVDDAGGRVALSGSSIVAGLTALDYETAASHSFTVRETLAGATNTPRDTVLSLTVTDVADSIILASDGTVLASSSTHLASGA